MKVELINYTGKGTADPSRFAANILVFTKATRLNMSSALMEEIEAKPWEDIEQELEYMSKTLPSSWEFVDFTFLASGVSRAFTHQLVRTRVASFAQQTQRVTNMSGFEVYKGETIKSIKQNAIWEGTLSQIEDAYTSLIEDGAKVEDARGLLPTNIKTNIVAKYNLRTVADTISKRSSARVQGEYRDYVNQVRDLVIGVYPWAELFIKNKRYDAALHIQEFLESHGADLDVLKSLDLIRGE